LFASSREAIERNDATAIREAVHRLAGAAGGIGCVRLQECAQAMEHDAVQNTVDARALEDLEACFRDSIAAVTHAFAAFEREEEAVDEARG